MSTVISTITHKADYPHTMDIVISNFDDGCYSSIGKVPKGTKIIETQFNGLYKWEAINRVNNINKY